ncbi:MAG TPA: CRTAC1 family protein [Chthonomonadaceae bacterium]|nr:CRTAC1 family protein [Chthonomonadaceae bacterium]
MLGCPGQKPPVGGKTASPAEADANPVHFVEVSKQVGIDFRHDNGAKGKKYMPETVGSGVAFLDYDNDGWQDILIVNGKNWPEDKETHSTLHLYHNNRNGTFTDVTQQSGLGISLYGMGVAVGDFDNDGYEDIYITAIGANHLFRNTLGDKNRQGPIFQDVTAQAGVQGVPMPGMSLQWKWSASAAWLDYDKDGKLDLFVCQYVKWSPSINKWCGHNGIRGYCPPGTFEGSYCTLYHNEGNGHFRDVSEEMGIHTSALGKSFGVVVADFNGDGWPDIAVTNDTWANFLFVNEQGKHFTEHGADSGIATGENGHYKAGMGIDTADWRNNGQFALLIGNFAEEGLSLFESDSKRGEPLLFMDNAHPTGLAEPSLPFLTFGLFFFDADLDGWQDVFTANGHVDDIVSTYDSMLTFKERPALYHNERNGAFKEIGVQSGLTEKLVGRGAAYGDIDNDGDLDIALVDNGGQFRLYRNEGGNRNHWIRLRTEGIRSNRDGIGVIARVTNRGITQSQMVHSGGSFLSECQRQLTFGLGSRNTVESIEVLWPSGTIDRAQGLRANRQYLIQEGQGIHEDPRFLSMETNRE